MERPRPLLSEELDVVDGEGLAAGKELPQVAEPL